MYKLPHKTSNMDKNLNDDSDCFMREFRIINAAWHFRNNRKFIRELEARLKAHRISLCNASTLVSKS
jgi:hypothetical protein